MISAGHPQCIAPFHALEADDGVLDGVGEGVADVKGARDIWRGDNYDKWLFVGVHVGLKEAALMPPVVPSCFDIPA
jgi:hypothetical protein